MIDMNSKKAQFELLTGVTTQSGKSRAMTVEALTAGKTGKAWQLLKVSSHINCSSSGHHFGKVIYKLNGK